LFLFVPTGFSTKIMAIQSARPEAEIAVTIPNKRRRAIAAPLPYEKIIFGNADFAAIVSETCRLCPGTGERSCSVELTVG
jgi:hypothetical protein